MSEKVDGGNGRMYTRDHPHEIISPYVMRFTEIRAWLKELSTNKEYGWYPGGVSGLARALGMSSGGVIKHKLTTDWIWPKEQVRLTARIRDIIDGRIVPRRTRNRVDGVYCDPAVPPVVADKPRTIHLRATVAGLDFMPVDHKPLPKLPCFRSAFAEAIWWDPDSRRR
jgi:hypothetical protein